MQSSGENQLNSTIAYINCIFNSVNYFARFFKVNLKMDNSLYFRFITTESRFNPLHFLK